MKKIILGLFLGTALLVGCKSETEQKPDLNISLAQWSLHKSFFGDALNGDWATFGRLLKENPDSRLQGKLHPDDFPKIAAGYGVNTIELVNTFHFSKA